MIMPWNLSNTHCRIQTVKLGTSIKIRLLVVFRGVTHDT